jgi:uncharacterized protein (DUF1697 family)
MEEAQVKTFIALFRGINVGGRNILPMKELVVLLKNLGLQSVKTYIQSGNAVFRCEPEQSVGLSTRIKSAVSERYGFEPEVLLLSLAELEEVVAANPFKEAESDPKTLHFYFLEARPESPDMDTLNSLKQDSERFSLTPSVFYLHAPNGIGRSKLAAKVEKPLGVAATARNWRSVCKIAALATQVEKT